MTNWTIEELGILDLYNRGSRLSTRCMIEEVLPYLLDEPETCRIVRNTLKKLDTISDTDFYLMMLGSDPLWEDEEVERYE